MATDNALLTDPEFRPLVEKYAKDNAAFCADYAEAHKRLSELGSTGHPCGHCWPARPVLIFCQGTYVRCGVLDLPPSRLPALVFAPRERGGDHLMMGCGVDALAAAACPASERAK
eukprot:358057-Chlamydomonas_euryale.AAC.3